MDRNSIQIMESLFMLYQYVSDIAQIWYKIFMLFFENLHCYYRCLIVISSNKGNILNKIYYISEILLCVGCPTLKQNFIMQNPDYLCCYFICVVLFYSKLWNYCYQKYLIRQCGCSFDGSYFISCVRIINCVTCCKGQCQVSRPDR